MRNDLIVGCLVIVLAGCGGSEADGGDAVSTEDTTGAEGEGGGGAVEDTGEGALAADEPAEDEEEDDGMRCLPVSHCHSFANQSCALVDEAGEIQDEAASAGRVQEACPGENGVAGSVTECFEYIEISESCRRRPELRYPEWPCGRTDAARCDVVM